MQQQQKVPLNSLNPQQISQIKQQLENDVNTLNSSLGQFRFAFQKFEECKQIIANTEAAATKDQILLPLSNSLFIPGHLDNERDGQRYYLIEYGTGFFVERNAKQASQFCDRKNQLIKEKSEKLASMINEKKMMLEKCNITLMAIMQQQQQQQAK